MSNSLKKAINAKSKAQYNFVSGFDDKKRRREIYELISQSREVHSAHPLNLHYVLYELLLVSESGAHAYIFHSCLKRRVMTILRNKKTLTSSTKFYVGFTMRTLLFIMN